MIKIVVFVLISACILAFSLKSLRNPRSHGFYRFFAFELLLVLILLNVDVWFANIFSPLQIFSWILLIGSLVLAIHGFALLRLVGRPDGNFENTTELVKVGAYRFIRHPLYASLLLLGWGTFFKDCSVAALIVTLAITLFLIGTGRAEERENLERFGAAYVIYMRSTKMFVPFLL